MGTDLHVDAFVPALVLSRLAQDVGREPAPTVDRFDAAVLVVDLSGFSSIAERLSRRGSRGAEDLKDLLNLFFGPLVMLVEQHGGDIITFPGDAVLAIWPQATSAQDATRSAVQCAAAARE